jgi:tetratricopeptide (TPR) repeat protein
MTVAGSPEGGGRRGVLRRLLSLLVVAAAVLQATHAGPVARGGSEPYLPDSDATLLQALPAGRNNSQLRALQSRLGSAPQLPAALELARAYIEVARSAGDSRYSSYALATLAPWRSRKLAPRDTAQVLTLIAIAQQNLHRFDPALDTLQQALQLDPGAGQAWLTRAGILTLRGRYAEARRACGPLARTADPLFALACLATADGRSGKLQSSFSALSTVYHDDARIDSATRIWIALELADMAQRLGRPAEAERRLRGALQLDAGNIAVTSALADLLLRQSRPTEAMTLLAQGAEHDALLLRLAIAARRLQPDGTQARELAALYQDRVVRAQRPDEPQHLREEARFLLEVRADPALALPVARRNFAIQREPEDVRILRAAARAAVPGAAQARVELEDWLRSTGYEDAG